MARNWNDMPNEVKFMIVDNMDIVTRTKLKMCSKSDRCIVESVPMHVESFSACHRVDSKEFEIDSFCLRKNDDGKFEKTIYDKSYQPYQLPKKLRKYKGRHLFKKFTCNLLLRGNLHMDYFATDLDFPSKLTHTTIDAKTVDFNGKCEEIIKWINVLSPKAKEIRIDGSKKDEDVLVGIGLIPLIINAEQLYIWRENDITDEQLMTFKFTEGGIYLSKVTRNGAIQFIQKIASSDYPLGTEIEISFINDTGDDVDEMIRYLPMNSEKEVVYIHHRHSNSFTIYVQEAGGPVKTYRQFLGVDEMDE